MGLFGSSNLVCSATVLRERRARNLAALTLTATHYTHLTFTHYTHLTSTHYTHLTFTHYTHLTFTHYTHLTFTHYTHLTFTHYTHLTFTHCTHLTSTHYTHLTFTHYTHLTFTQETHDADSLKVRYCCFYTRVGFVSHRPHHNRGMVLVPPYHLLHHLKMVGQGGIHKVVPKVGMQGGGKLWTKQKAV